MADRDVKKLFIGRDGDAVGAVYIHRHEAGTHLAFDFRAGGAEANQDDLVGGFADYVDEVVLCGSSGWRRGLRGNHDCKQ